MKMNKEKNRIYECDYCQRVLEDGDDAIFIDRIYFSTGLIFCSQECLMHFLDAYEGTLTSIKPLIDADEKYMPTYVEHWLGGSKTAACDAVRDEAMKDSSIVRYGED